MTGKRFLSLALSICMLLSLIPAAPARAAESDSLEFEKLDGSSVNLDLTAPSAVENMTVEPQLSDEDMVRVIIVMTEEGVAQADPQAELNDETQQQIDELQLMQNALVEMISHRVMNGAPLEVDYNYTWLFNGVATTVPFGTIEAIEAMEGVDRVMIQQVYNVCQTDSTIANPNTATDGVMIGRESAWANGYTGEGMKIAIIDTGLDTDHPNFAALGEDKLTDTSATADSVAAVLANLNASKRYPGLTIGDVYRSTKVVYGFNYCDNATYIDHLDQMGDHGTHVAGIAAANKISGSDVVGVAPDAQLYVMKVFGANGGAYTKDILAALEDALMLGADVVNMSLGSPAGFTSGEYTAEGDFLDEVYAGVAATGTVLSVSAGNNFNSGYANLWGTDKNLTAYPDNGVVGAPGSYINTMTVASVENWKIQRNYIDADGYQISYNDSADFGLPALTTLTGHYEFVVIPGNGEPSDYEGLDLTGKVALVQRGVTSFLEKHQAAEAAGAAAILVYNNTDVEFGMDMTDTTCTTPAAAISMADGAYLIAAQKENPQLMLSFPRELAAFPSSMAYEMSDFSSPGPAPDLTLAPDITAPGGNIYSTLDNGGYGLMSGTSMAAPNIAGLTALVMQYVKENFPAGTDYRAVTQSLLMSTSVPLLYDAESGLAYSPRSQGSGLANAFNAVTTQAYLTVDGADNVKADLGDDAGRTGSYSFSFNVHNFGDTAAFYELSTSVQTEGVDDYGGIYFMSGTPVALYGYTEETSDAMALKHDVDNDGDADSHDAYYIYQAAAKTPLVEGWEAESFRYDVNADEAVAEADVQAYLDALVGKTSEADLEAEVLKVNAGETAQVQVNVTLAEHDKAYFATYYPNGGYVEGFTTLTALHSEGVELSLPYLGFYGDWAESPILDNAPYWDYLNAGENEYVGNQYIHALFSQFGGDDFGIYPGMNPYVENETLDVSHISLSPNGDGYLDSITDIYLSLMRNASYLSMRFTNVDTGEVFYDLGGSNVSKSVFNPNYGQLVPFVYTMYVADPLPDLSAMANNTHLLFEAEVQGVDENDEPEIWAVPITIDLEAPELLGVQRIEDPDNGTVSLELTFRDNLSAAVAIIADGSGSKLVAMEGVEDVAADENGYQNYTKTFDITGVSGKLMIILSDYAVNESYYGINLGGEGAPYGDLVAYQYNFNTGINGWVAFNGNVAQDEITIFNNYEMDFVAAEYVNGFVYAQTESGALYGFRYTDMLNNTMTLEDVYITQLDNVYQDLAYSYAEGKLYGLLTFEDGGYPTAEVYSINIRGEYQQDAWTTVAPYQEDWVLNRGGLYGLAMAIDDAGTVYVLGPKFDWNTESMTDTATLWSVGMEYDEWSGEYMLGWGLSEIGDVGMTMDYLQSMAWDHNAEKLYWARFAVEGYYPVAELIEIDPAAVTENEDGTALVSAVKVGDLSGETCALFAPLSDESAAKDEHSNVPVMDTSVAGTPILRDSTVTMNLGGSKVLTYDVDPWYTSVKDMLWSSSDESVVTVDQNGKITALAAGSVTITVTNAADETKFDTCTVEVTALDLKLEGIVSAQGSGIGNVAGVGIYEFTMTDGVAAMNGKANITAAPELNYGLSLATSEFARGSIWACEYGNTGMVYEIDPATGAVKEVFMPIDGDMMFGMHYSEKLDSFTNIMNFYLYTDIPMTQEMYEEMEGSYSEETKNFMWHRINMLPYLRAAGGSFVTGETGQGASSEVVFCAITGIDGGIRDSYGQTYYYDTYKDYLGNWAMGGMCSYQPDQTLILLDNVGRLWYINQVTGVSMESDEWGNVFLTTPDGGSIDASRNGVIVSDYTAEDGTYSVFHITQIVETPLTQMFREGTMPRITYHFSDIEFAGYSAEGDPMIAMSLYDYWNNGTTNELYLYVPGHDTGMMDENWEPIYTPDRLFDLGNTGEYNIIATIHSAEVTGGVDPEPEVTASVSKLAAGVYKAG